MSKIKAEPINNGGGEKMEEWMPLIISVKTTLAATIITFFIGIFTAWYIDRVDVKYRGVLDAVLTLPMVLPPTVVGFFLLLILGRKGIFGNIFHSIGINIVFSWSATVIAAVVVSFPLMYKTVKGAFEQIDKNLINAARTMGVSDLKIFTRVIVPLAWPGIVAGTVLSFARALGEFGATLMIAGNIPGKTQTIPIAIYFAAEGGDMKSAMGWVAVVFTVSMSVMILMNYWNNYQKKNSKMW